jgi:hypothetical protein
VSGHILHLAISHSHVFLLNSRLGHFSATSCIAARRQPFSRSYRFILPSSLAMNLSSTLGFSPQLPVSVCGTGNCKICLADFLGSLIRFTQFGRSLLVLSGFSIKYGLACIRYTYTLKRPFVCARNFHYSFSTSLLQPVREY